MKDPCSQRAFCCYLQIQMELQEPCKTKRSIDADDRERKRMRYLSDCYDDLRKEPCKTKRRNDANDRERKRMRYLNDCFDDLRKDFLWYNQNQDRKTSKVQVLIDTHIYIRELEKRVEPELLRELRLNFSQYKDQTCGDMTEFPVDRNQTTAALDNCQTAFKKQEVKQKYVPDGGNMSEPSQFHSCARRMVTHTTSTLYQKFEWTEPESGYHSWGPIKRSSEHHSYIPFVSPNSALTYGTMTSRSETQEGLE